MSNLTLTLDKETEENLKALKKHYGLSSKAAVIAKSLGLLKTAAQIENSKGQLIAKQGKKEIELLLK